jgi:hypothetical protein
VRDISLSPRAGAASTRAGAASTRAGLAGASTRAGLAGAAAASRRASVAASRRALANAPPPTLPPGWAEATADDGQVYYFHEQSGETSWDFPTERPRLTSPSRRDIPARASPRLASNAPLPPGWEEARADDGQVYYFREDSGETSWDRPV